MVRRPTLAFRALLGSVLQKRFGQFNPDDAQFRSAAVTPGIERVGLEIRAARDGANGLPAMKVEHDSVGTAKLPSVKKPHGLPSILDGAALAPLAPTVSELRRIFWRPTVSFDCRLRS